jgi:aldehyde dehydrogenase (NAD+)
VIQRNRIFINGKWLPSAGNATISVINPVTEEPAATIPAGTAADVDLAARAAAAAFPAWSQTSVEERIAMLRRLARLTAARADEITRAIVSEIGQPVKIAAESQSAAAVEDLLSITEFLPEITWSERVGSTQVVR